MARGRYGHMIKSLIVIGDFFCLNLAYAVVCLFGGGVEGGFAEKIIWLLLNLSYYPVYLFFSNIHELRILHVDRVLVKVSQAILSHLAAFLLLVFFLQIEYLSEVVLIKFYILLSVLLAVWWVGSRKLLKIFRRKGYNFKRVVIVGAGTMGVKLLDELRSDAGYGYKFMGFFDDNLALKKSLPGFQGNCLAVEDFALQNNVDEIYCALPMWQEEKITRLLKFAEAHTISFYMVPDVGRYIHRQLEFRLVGNVPVLSLHPEPLRNVYSRLLKRAFDLVFSTVVLICSPVIFIPIAIAVKLSSPGPVFFKQKRTGFKGKEFNCYKFRTMRVNADSDEVQATRNDPRKTRVGEFLRKTSLDELPQFINVFLGDMSVVGPRPHMVKHTLDYSKIIDKYMLRHLIKPGITGWAQVNGYRGETRELWQMERRVEYDVWYIEHWNFWLDIKIIFLTVFNAFKGEKNAF